MLRADCWGWLMSSAMASGPRRSSSVMGTLTKRGTSVPASQNPQLHAEGVLGGWCGVLGPAWRKACTPQSSCARRRHADGIRWDAAMVQLQDSAAQSCPGPLLHVSSSHTGLGAPSMRPLRGDSGPSPRCRLAWPCPVGTQLPHQGCTAGGKCQRLACSADSGRATKLSLGCSCVSAPFPAGPVQSGSAGLGSMVWACSRGHTHRRHAARPHPPSHPPARNPSRSSTRCTGRCLSATAW